MPLAAALWHGGISFGGVVSFVFADLITLPLLLIYRRYFGTAITVRLLVVFWAVMSLAGLADRVPVPGGRHPAARPARAWSCAPGSQWNYTTVLNLHRAGRLRRPVRRCIAPRPPRTSAYAKDPVCGMQVEKAHAPATSTIDGEQYWFCSEHCQHAFQYHARDHVGHHGGAS